MKAVEAPFNQKKVLVGAFSVIMKLSQSFVSSCTRLDRHAITQWSVAHVEPSEQLIGIIKTNNKI